jgi:hypothetical protein
LRREAGRGRQVTRCGSPSRNHWRAGEHRAAVATKPRCVDAEPMRSSAGARGGDEAPAGSTTDLRAQSWSCWRHWRGQRRGERARQRQGREHGGWNLPVSRQFGAHPALQALCDSQALRNTSDPAGAASEGSKSPAKADLEEPGDDNPAIAIIMDTTADRNLRRDASFGPLAMVRFGLSSAKDSNTKIRGSFLSPSSFCCISSPTLYDCLGGRATLRCAFAVNEFKPHR